MNRQARAAAFTLCLAAIAAAAEPADGEQRERIVAERAQAAARLAEQEQVCRARFVVAACLDAARKEHGATLTRLHREEMQLDDVKRRAIAATRSEAVREKAAARAARASEAVSDAASDATSDGPREAKRKAPQPHPPPRQRPAGSTARAPASAASQRLDEQRNEAQFEARVREAQAHRETVERRNAERAAKGKVAAPLPVPAGASAP
jgi:colicin import membrane protein